MRVHGGVRDEVVAAQVVAAHVGVVGVTIIVVRDPLVVGVVAVSGVLGHHAAVAQVAVEVGDAIHLVGILAGHTRVAHHHRVVLIQFARELCASRVAATAAAVPAVRYTRRRAVIGIAP